MRSAAALQDWMMPLRSLDRIASSDDSTIAARYRDALTACVSSMAVTRTQQSHRPRDFPTRDGVRPLNSNFWHPIRMSRDPDGRALWPNRPTVAGISHADTTTLSPGPRRGTTVREIPRRKHRQMPTHIATYGAK